LPRCPAAGKTHGTEGVSELFRFKLDLLAEKPVPFEGLLGEKVTVTLNAPGSPVRYFSGIICRLIQEGRVQAADEKTTFIRYQAELVPRFWFLTKNVQSRIFQHLSVPDILKQVLQSLDVSYDIRGDFAARDFCVQYRESDGDFASRLMEEEGIFYYFEHTADGHRLHLTDHSLKHPELQGPSTIDYDVVAGGSRNEARVNEWRKMQEICVGHYSLWDHSFELPGQNLQTEQAVLNTVTVGQVNHKVALK
jgi:type VI secretion system secreted protein VgrG